MLSLYLKSHDLLISINLQWSQLQSMKYNNIICEKLELLWQRIIIIRFHFDSMF